MRRIGYTSLSGFLTVSVETLLGARDVGLNIKYTDRTPRTPDEGPIRESAG